MTDAHEVVEGIGELERWENPQERTLVQFRFDITTEILQRSGFPRLGVRSRSQGIVRTLSGQAPGDGEYRLIAPEEELKVKNLGDLWVILAS